MKLVFLDFDGVLNHEAWFKQGHPRTPFDPACVLRVRRLCERTGCRIVVSSSWRTPLTRDRLPWLRGLLHGAGIGTAEIVGCTPDLSASAKHGIVVARTRADEIRAYLAKRPAKAFVILDDEAWAEIDGHFVKTDFQGGGLTDELLEKAVAIVGERTEEVNFA